MSDDQIRRIIDDSYDDSREQTLRAMLADFYSRKMMSTAILVWSWAIIFLVLAVYSAMRFFKADQTREQIMYAALFIVGAYGLGLMKIFAWGMVHRHSISRDLKRVELRIAQLDEMLRNR